MPLKWFIGAVMLVAAATAQADPAKDLKQFQDYFKKKFPNVEFADYANGAYALDEKFREQWKEMEEFPPYELDVDAGKALWEKPFANGKSYKDCFTEDLKDIRAKYPYYDAKKDTIATIEGALNECRKSNGEEPIKDLKRNEMAQLVAYVAMEGRGQKINIPTPKGGALKWYEKGKNFFYTKRGQLNMACADCHSQSSGKFLRAELLSPALGHTTHWPVYRSKWGYLGTLHQRYIGCNEQVRAQPFKPQSDEYKALEFFETYMSNGLEWNGPASRK